MLNHNLVVFDLLDLIFFLTENLHEKPLSI